MPTEGSSRRHLNGGEQTPRGQDDSAPEVAPADRPARALKLDRLDDQAHTGELRARMAAIRAHAAADREQAARDREHAARDRAQAARERRLAALDRAAAQFDRRAAGTDELTGARRRGVGLEELEREIDRARRTGESLVAVFVDVDNLKAVNDGLGHSAGDEVLREVVKALRRRLRSYDLIIRLGGDEFVCALPGVSVDRARVRFAGLNDDLAKRSAHASVSVGFSDLHDREGRPGLIDRADHDMLAARSDRRSASAAR